MKFENNERTPWEKSKQANNLHTKNEVMQEASKLGWGEPENLGVEAENTIAKNTVQSTMHFKNKVMPKGGGATGVVMAIKDEAVKRIKQYVVDTAKRKEEESKKKEEKNGSPILLALCGIVFAIVFLFVTPIILLFNEVTAIEPKIVTAAKLELSVSEDNVGGQKYKDWYGVNGNWCAMFVSYCANECDFLTENIMPQSASVMEMSEWFKEKEQWKEAGDYVPKAGDIIFFQNDMSHVGIVIAYDAVDKTITTIEGNAGAADTTLEYGHEWQKENCHICGGDHMTSEEEICGICKGTGYLLLKSGTANMYKDYYSIMKYTGCGSCGGSGTETDYYNQFGLAWHEGEMILGAGKTGENLFCTACFGVGPYMGEVVRCNVPDCIMSSFGAWGDYPDGVCYTTECEYHEASKVTQKKYPLTYVKISGYGLPDYNRNWFEELFTGE